MKESKIIFSEIVFNYTQENEIWVVLFLKKWFIL